LILSRRSALAVLMVASWGCGGSRGASPNGLGASGDEIWLADFESESELADQWTSRQVETQLCEEGVTHGRRAVRLTFEGESASSFVMARQFERSPELGDWTGRTTLRFDLSNLEDEPVRIVLQLKDAEGRRLKRPIELGGGEIRRYALELSDVEGEIDLATVRQFQLFRWRGRRSEKVVVDSVRVTGREGAGATAASRQDPDEGAEDSIALAPLVLEAGDLRWLGDFESGDELNENWQSEGVRASVSESGVAHGRSAARITFLPGRDPGFALERALGRHPELGAWRPEETLALSLFNPEADQIRVILQLKDADGGVYKEAIYVPSKVRQDVEVPLDRVAQSIDVGSIRQLKLFRWRPREAATVYVDAIRLFRRPAEEASPADEDPPLVAGSAWQVTWASSLEKLFPEPSSSLRSRPLPAELALARGESESLQLVVLGGDRAVRVTAEAGPLERSGGGALLPVGSIEVRNVGFVTTHRPYYPVVHVGEWPDPLLSGSEVEVPAGRVRSMWVTVSAPRSQPPGTYSGRFRLTASDGRATSVDFRVRVFDFEVPATPNLVTAFDFYRFRMEKAYREFVPGGSRWAGKMHALERLYDLEMLKHRLSPMIGRWPDSRSFAAEMHEYVEHGATSFAVGSLGGSNGNNWPRDPEALARAAQRYSKAARALEEQGLESMAYVYAYDEPALGSGHARQVLEALDEAAPNLRLLVVLQQPPDPARHEKWLAAADIVCLHITAWNPRVDRWLREHGKQVWIYVSSPVPPYPSLEIDTSPMAPRILGWMCWKYRIEGLLYWCVNFWRTDPWSNPATFAADQNGNGFLFYPGEDGPVPTIRLAALRDGLEDFEYLRLLQDLVDRAREKGLPSELVAKGERLLTLDPGIVASMRSYSADPRALLERRAAVAGAIEELHGRLEH